MIRNFDDNHDDDNNDNADKHDDNNDDDNDDNVDNHDDTMMMTTMSQIFTSQAPCRESSASWKRSSRWKNDLQAEDFDHLWDEAFDHCVDDFDHCGEDFDHYCDEDEDEARIYDPH